MAERFINSTLSLTEDERHLLAVYTIIAMVNMINITRQMLQDREASLMMHALLNTMDNILVLMSCRLIARDHGCSRCSPLKKGPQILQKACLFCLKTKSLLKS